MTQTERTAACPAGGGPARPQVRCPVWLVYGIGGDLRFLSHHNEMRMLQRALVRAGWPLAYSHGFNPRPRLVIPLPRNLGTEALHQVALTELREPRRAEELHAGLAAQLPVACQLQRVIAPAARRGPQARGVVYEVIVDPQDTSGLPERIADLLRQAALVVQRDCGPGRPTRPCDVRPYIENIEFTDQVLRLTLRFVAQRTARPSEVIAALGLTAEAYAHRLRRVAVHWDAEFAAVADWPAPRERNESGSKEEDFYETG